MLTKLKAADSFIIKTKTNICRQKFFLKWTTVNRETKTRNKKFKTETKGRLMVVLKNAQRQTKAENFYFCCTARAITEMHFLPPPKILPHLQHMHESDLHKHPLTVELCRLATVGAARRLPRIRKGKASKRQRWKIKINETKCFYCVAWWRYHLCVASVLLKKYRNFLAGFCLF